MRVLYMHFSAFFPAAFALNGHPLSDESGDQIAFRDFPKDLVFVPAVTAFLGEQVELILTKSQVSRY